MVDSTTAFATMSTALFKCRNAIATSSQTDDGGACRLAPAGDFTTARAAVTGKTMVFRRGRLPLASFISPCLLRPMDQPTRYTGLSVRHTDILKRHCLLEKREIVWPVCLSSRQAGKVEYVHSIWISSCFNDGSGANLASQC